MHLDQDAVRASGNSSAGHGDYFVPQSRPVARVGDDWQVRQPMHDRNCGEVEHIARGRIEASHAPLAEYHVLISLGQDVLRAEEKIIDRSCHSALEQHRLLHFADGLEQRVVLHVARADLNAVGDFGHQLCAFGVHRLCDNWKPGFFSRAREKGETLFPHSLEGVRRATWLEGSAAQGVSTGSFYDSSGGHDLFFGFHRAWATDDYDRIATHCNAGAQFNDCVLGSPLARDLLVWLSDVDDLRYARQCLETRRIDASVVADESNRGALRTRHRPRLIAHFLDDRYDAIDVFRRRVVLHDY